MVGVHEHDRGRPGEGGLTGVTDQSDTTRVASGGPIRWYADGDACCPERLTGLRFPDGRVRCIGHATDTDLELVDALDTRAAGIGLRRTTGRSPFSAYAWPYGPNVDVAARARMLDWAEGHRLRLAQRGHRCLRWLRTGRCRWCDAGDGAGLRPWLDHVTTWTRDGAPAVLVAQPYHLDGQDLEDLAVVTDDPALRLELAEHGSWYGHGTWYIGIWRAEQ